MINSGRSVNDGMGKFIATELVKQIIKAGKNVLHSKILVLGATFKENVSDIRNSKVADVVFELQSYGILVDVVDPYASAKEVEEEYGYTLLSKITKKYDAVVAAVSHEEYLAYEEKDFSKLLAGKGIIFDVKGVYRNKIKNLTYLSL